MNKWNNGKDLMPGDIKVFDVNGKKVAMLGFQLFDVNKRFLPSDKNKIYYSFGQTKEESINRLIDIMEEHLDKLRV